MFQYRHPRNRYGRYAKQTHHAVPVYPTGFTLGVGEDNKHMHAGNGSGAEKQTCPCNCFAEAESDTEKLLRPTCDIQESTVVHGTELFSSKGLSEAAQMPYSS